MATLPMIAPEAANQISESVRLLRALRHLNQLLPLKYRQAALPPELVAVHRAILHSFAESGRPLTAADIAVMLGGKNAALRALAVLATNDLVVLNEAAVKQFLPEGDPIRLELESLFPPYPGLDDPNRRSGGVSLTHGSHL